MKKINLLHLITGLGVGGAERVVLDLVKNADRKQYDVSVVSMSKRVEMLEEFKNNNINVTALEKNSSFREFMQIATFLNRYVKKNKIDIIHAHMTHAMLAAAMVKIVNPKIKIVFTSHSINMESKTREIILFLLKPLRSKDILFSDEQISFFYKKNYMCIPNGIEVSNYELNVEKNSIFTFLAVGRLDHEKNHRLLIEIAKLIPCKYKFEIWLAGDGVLSQELKDLAIQYEITERVKFLGLRRDIPILLNKVNCFVMPSLWEGLPIALLEAGASSLPVIATPVGSIPSLLNDENSYLASEDQFLESMIEVMENYSEALKKAKRLKKEIISNYSLEAIVKEHEDIYSELMDE